MPLPSMAPKAHRTGATGLPRTHSRTSSTGSSKAALNLQFTQKDSSLPKQPEKTKKTIIGQDVCLSSFFSAVLSDFFFSISPSHTRGIRHLFGG